MTIRKSVPTKGVARYWDCGWAYVMPDFDNKDHSIIEWFGDQPPLEPLPVFTASPQIEGTAEAV